MAAPPRIVLAANAIPGEGGQGLNLLHMMKGLEASFDLKVFCLGPRPPFRTQLIPRSRWIPYFFSRPLIRRLRDWPSYLEERHFDFQVRRRLEPCAVFQAVTGQCFESLARARELGARTLLDVVTVNLDDGIRRVHLEHADFGVRPRINAFQNRRQRGEYQRADLIRVMSHHAQRTFLERGFSPEKVVVVHPPMAVDEFPIARFDQPVFRVSYVGRLEISKGFHHLVEAFERARLPEAELILWGGPGSRPVTNYLNLRMQRNPAIRLRPVAVRDVGFAEVYGKSHVVVHPSPADGFGYSVAEAMACGVPVIVTSTTGAADWVEDGVNGFIVPPRDPEAIRERLQWCHDNPARLPELGRAARETVRHYDLARFRSTYLPLVRRLAG